MIRFCLRLFKAPLFLFSADKRVVLSYHLHQLTSRLLGTMTFWCKARWYGLSYDAMPECFGSAQIFRESQSNILLGKNIQLISSSNRATASTLYSPVRLRTLSPQARIILGDKVGLNGTSITARSKTIQIGSGTLIAPNVTIVDSPFHAQWPPEERWFNMAYERDTDIVIGKNVWIGMQCLILSGSEIGENSIIAAGSVVNSRIPANVLAGGVPAKVLKKLGEA